MKNAPDKKEYSTCFFLPCGESSMCRSAESHSPVSFLHHRVTHSVGWSGGTAVFLVSSGGQCGDEQNMKISIFGTYRVGHLEHIGPKVAFRLW